MRIRVAYCRARGASLRLTARFCGRNTVDNHSGTYCSGRVRVSPVAVVDDLNFLINLPMQADEHRIVLPQLERARFPDHSGIVNPRILAVLKY